MNNQCSLPEEGLLCYEFKEETLRVLEKGHMPNYAISPSIVVGEEKIPIEITVKNVTKERVWMVYGSRGDEDIKIIVAFINNKHTYPFIKTTTLSA